MEDSSSLAGLGLTSRTVGCEKGLGGRAQTLQRILRDVLSTIRHPARSADFDDTLIRTVLTSLMLGV